MFSSNWTTLCCLAYATFASADIAAVASFHFFFPVVESVVANECTQERKQETANNVADSLQ